MRVVVVEDDEDLLELASLVLRKAGHEPLGATDGAAGTELILTSDPDLVLLDLMLPIRDGFEVLDVLREAGASDRVPVVVLSALVSKQDQQRALEAGAVDFLPKPYSPQALIELAQALGSATPEQLTRWRMGALARVTGDVRSEPDGRVDRVASTPIGRPDSGQVLAGVLDLSVDAIVSVDADQRIIGFNRGAERMFGYRTDAVLGQPLDELLPTHLVAVHREHLRAFGRSPEASRHMGERHEIHGRRKDGSLFPAEASILKNVVDGRLTFTAVLRDVSERAQLITELRLRARQQEAIAKLGQHALSGAALGPFLQESAAMVADTLGVQLVEIAEQLPSGLVVRCTNGRLDGDSGSTEGLGARSYAGYVLAADQPVISPDLRVESRFDASGPASHGVVSGVGVPVPGQRQQFGALCAYSTEHRTFSDDDVHFLQAVANVIAALVSRSRVEARLRTFLDAAPDATLVVDERGRVVTANPQAVELLGYPADDLVGMTVEQLVPERFRETHAAHREAFRSEPRLRPMGAGSELAALRADGQEVAVDIMLSPLETEEGVLVVAAMRDITERRRNDAMREAFLRAVSHDLRTPLASLVGFAGILADEGDLPSGQRHFVDRILVNARKLERLLRDLLDLDRISRGVLQPNRRPTDLAALVEGVRESVALGPEHPIEVHVAPDVSVASIDPGQVERLLENLLINVGRHTPAGTPCRIELSRVQEGILLAVADSGPGVPDELKATIFDPFQRGQDHEHSPGTGIGLSLVARFAEMHEGRAWIEDAPGGGAVFKIVLPDG